MVYEIFGTKKGWGEASKVKANVNDLLVQELHKPVITKFTKRSLFEVWI